MVVPNGSGSLIRFNNGKNSAAVYSQYVYDMDLIDGDYTQTQTIQSVRLPLWGVCRENTSVLATIENGASRAKRRKCLSSRTTITAKISSSATHS